MAHDNITNSSRTVPSHLGRRVTPNRSGSGDSSSSDPMRRRKMRGLRGKSGATNDGEYVESFNNSFEVDREDKMGSSRSIKSHESNGSSGGDSYGEASFACDSSYAMPNNLRSTVSVSTLGSVPEASSSSRMGLPNNSHGGLAPRRGAVRGMVPMVGSQNNNNSISGVSEHSTTSLSSMGSNLSGGSRLSNASQLSSASQSLYRNGTRGRSRGLSNKQVSTLRITEPGSAPMVSSLGTVAPMAPSLGPLSSSSHSSSTVSSPQRRSIRVDQRAFSAIPRPVLPENQPRSVAPCSVAASCQSSLTSLLNDSDREEMTISSSSQSGAGCGGRRDSMMSAAAARYSLHPPAAAASITTNQRSTPLPSRPSPSSRPLPAVAAAAPPPEVPIPARAAAPAPAARVVPAFVREAQELAEKMYEPTEEDWANLYKKHVEVLERKDMEIAMRLSSISTPVVGGVPTRNEDDELGLALQVSTNESSSLPVVDEEKMLQMVLEMSRHEESVAGHDEGSLDTNNNSRSLTEEEELERVLRMSEQEATQIPLNEDEELERVLRMSQIQQEETSDDDEEFLRVLQMSQKEATEQQRERETMELVLRLSQQGTDGVW